MPGIVAAREYLAAAPNAAVMLLEAHAYSQGCLLELVSVARAAGPEPLDAGPGPRVAVDVGGAVLDPSAGGRLLGTGRLTWRAAPRAAGDSIVRRLDEEPARTARQVRHTTHLWISPLPPVEGFLLTVAWPEHGIVETTVKLPGDAIRQAAWDSYPMLPA